MQRFLTLLHARNLEFMRDRAALSWNLIFPILLVIGFAAAFSGDERDRFKVGTIAADQAQSAGKQFLETRYLEFIPYAEQEKGVEKVGRHQIALLVDFATQRYWVNDTSPDGYMVERLLSSEVGDQFERIAVAGNAVRYVDWVLPGILGMNMMFSALFGVGYVIVRYRKNGVLKRLKATPLTAFEFLTVQVLSRLLIILAVAGGLFTACSLLIDFPMRGSYLSLLVIGALGGFCLISMGLLVAARTASEEWAGGLLNFFTWPMMFLSGVWFSLEGSPDYLQWGANLLPLTHLVAGARAIMIDGATLFDVMPQAITLAVLSVVFLAIGARFFRWDVD